MLGAVVLSLPGGDGTSPTCWQSVRRVGCLAALLTASYDRVLKEGLQVRFQEGKPQG